MVSFISNLTRIRISDRCNRVTGWHRSPGGSFIEL